MLEKELPSELRTRRDVVTAFILLFFTLSWWPLTILIFQKFSQPSANLATSASYYLSVVVSSIIGAGLGKRIRNLSFLYYWMVAGAISSLIPIFFISTAPWHSLAVSALLGFTFGIGMPSCLAFFAEFARLETRGTISGVIFLTSNLAIVMLSIVLRSSELTNVALVAAGWRALGLVLFILLRPKWKIEDEVKRHVSFGSVFQDRRFLFYFIPWLAFCLIDWFEKPIRDSLFGGFASSAYMIGLAISGVFTLVGGISCDRLGRKIMVLYGFVSIGVAYAVLSVAPGNVLVWYFHMIIEAVAWGIFYPIFILTLWGDLSQPYVREKYYAIGSIPFFIVGIFELFIGPYASLIHPEAAFSLAAFFLFLAVIPLLYAPETLPEKRIKERELKGYLEKAKKLKEKHV